jgi:uncharacterized protein (DUF488 family)
MLGAHGVTALADVRTVARSRHNPQFNEEDLAASLEKRGFAYHRLALLGGLRHARADSENAGWRNASFRGYADYMETADFREGIDQLTALGESSRTAIMCAEAVPWRCHRSMIGDALLVRGFLVSDIMTEKSAKPHVLTSFAVVEGLRITYPAPVSDEPGPESTTAD